MEKGNGAGAAEDDEDDGVDGEDGVAGEDRAAAPGPEAVDGLRLGIARCRLRHRAVQGSFTRAQEEEKQKHRCGSNSYSRTESRRLSTKLTQPAG